MAERKLGDVFKRFIPLGIHKEIFEQAADVKVRLDRENRIAEVRCTLPKLYKKKDLYELEGEIARTYELAQMRILPRYPEELFNTDYMSEILAEAARVGVVINGFFNRYELETEEDVLRLKIPFTHGGISLLDLARTSDVISGIIHSEFGLQYKVEITQADNAQTQYEAFMQGQLAQLQSQSVLIMREAERLEAEAAKRAETGEAPEQAEPEKPALPKVASLFEGSDDIEWLEEGVIRSGKLVFNVAEPTVVFGEAFPMENILPLRAVKSTAKSAVILGEVFDIQSKDTRKGDKTMITVAMTDKEASLYIKLTVPIEQMDETMSLWGKGKRYAVRGSIKRDTFDGELFMQYTDILQVKPVLRQDKSEEKRVELHLHTCMSAMDATTKADEVVKTAARWGHKAVAITDHGNLQSFPVAMLTADGLKKDGKDIKILYGVEAYYVDDTFRASYKGEDVAFSDECIVFDIETTGLSAVSCKITEIGAVRIKGGQVLERFNMLVNPGEPIPKNIVELTGITDEMVANEPTIDVVLPKFFEFVGDKLLIAHNAAFDTGFIRQAAENLGLLFTNPYLDTLAMSRYMNPDLKNHKLDTLAKHYNLGDFNHHRACDDAEMLAQIYFCMAANLEEEGISNIGLMNYAMSEKADPLKLKTYHLIILVQNQTGMKNLYKLVSDGYLKYYRRNPRVPRSHLEELREGLIIGSACEAGELFSAIREGRSESDLLEMAQFYDYLEIQPISNNSFMIEQGMVKDEEELKNLNRRVVELGKKAGIPVCATCDAHYLNPEDEIYRRIILSGMKFKDADK